MKVDQLWQRGVAVTMALILAGCAPAAQEGPAAPPGVSILAVTPTQLDLFEVLPARVMAVRTAEIRAQVSGVVQRRLFEQGAEIKAGQPLFQINFAPFQADVDMAAAALQRAEAVHARAQIQTQRLQPLMAADAISRQLYDDAESQRDQAAADVAQARATLVRRQLDLKFATVEAPIAGRIDQALVTEGALVSTNDTTPMARIQQIDQVYVDVRQPAASLDAFRAALGNSRTRGKKEVRVNVLRSNGQPYGLTGQMLFSGITVDISTGDVLLRVLVNNPRRELLPGMFVRARIPMASYPDALMVPQQAVTHLSGHAQVWTVDEQNKVHAQTVELGEQANGQYRIRSGLTAGQQIVIAGLDRLSEGALIKPQPWTADPSAATQAAPTSSAIPAH